MVTSQTRDPGNGFREEADPSNTNLRQDYALHP